MQHSQSPHGTKMRIASNLHIDCSSLAMPWASHQGLQTPRGLGAEPEKPAAARRACWSDSGSIACCCTHSRTAATHRRCTRRRSCCTAVGNSSSGAGRVVKGQRRCRAAAMPAAATSSNRIREQSKSCGGSGSGGGGTAAPHTVMHSASALQRGEEHKVSVQHRGTCLSGELCSVPWKHSSLTALP